MSVDIVEEIYELFLCFVLWIILVELFWWIYVEELLIIKDVFVSEYWIKLLFIDFVCVGFVEFIVFMKFLVIVDIVCIIVVWIGK